MAKNILPFRRQRHIHLPGSAFRTLLRGNNVLYAITAGFSLALFLAIFLSGGPDKTIAAVGGGDVQSANFATCFGPIRRNCVVDGDTFWYGGRKIRISDINTPELSGAECSRERRLAIQAKDRLIALLNAGAFSLESGFRAKDKYGRDLLVVTRDGESIGEILVAEGLAEEWRGYRRNWC